MLKYNSPFSNGMSASLVLGQANFTSSSANRGGSVAANSVSSPWGLVFDSSGDFYVVDRSNNRVLKYATPFSDGMSATLVLGQANFTSGSANRGTSVGANTLYGSAGITRDSSGNVWVADYFNHRILKYLSSDAWKSYSDSGHSTAADSFTNGSQHTVYMYGSGFNPSTTYRVVFWDVVDSTWYNRGTEDATADSSGNLSAQHTFAEGTDTPGDWHSTVYNSTSYSPASYDANDAYLIVDDQSYTGNYAFTVGQGAIPELPTVLAGLIVAGLCAAIYLWRRARYQVASRSKHP